MPINAPFRKLGIIGLGLIGSSIARAARKVHLTSAIIGIDTNEVSLVYARKHGFVDQVSHDPTHAIADCDVIVIATSTHLLGDICSAIAPHIKPGTLIMDTGSVKQVPLAIMTELLPAHAVVIPAHPIAGSEESGVVAGRPDMFEKKRVIITPEAPLTHEQLQQVNNFWQSLGARVEAMPAELHDTVYGYISHLPQLLAHSAGRLVNPTDGEIEANESLRKFMRLTSSSTHLWSSILLLNRDIMLIATNRYLDVINHIRRELVSAPQEIVGENPSLARCVLFPRIVASCLITTVMEAEKKAGLGFVRFAGTGFGDFTAPALTDPDGDMENISNYHTEVASLLTQLEARLSAIIKALEAENAELLMQRLE